MSPARLFRTTLLFGPLEYLKTITSQRLNLGFLNLHFLNFLTCTVMTKLNKNLGIDEKALHKINRRTYFALLFLFILHVMSVITSIEFCQSLLVERIVFIPLSTIWLVTISIFYWPFPAAASFLVNRLCLFNLILQMDTFEYKAPKSRYHFLLFMIWFSS